MSIFKNKQFLSLLVIMGGAVFQIKSDTITFFVDPALSKNERCVVSKELSFSFATEYVISPLLNKGVEINDIEFVFAQTDGKKGIIHADVINHQSEDFVSDEKTIGEVASLGQESNENMIFMVRKYGSDFLPAGYHAVQVKEEESDSVFEEEKERESGPSLGATFSGEEAVAPPMPEHLLGQSGHGLPPAYLEKEEASAFSLKNKVVEEQAGVWNAVIAHGEKFIAVGMGDSVDSEKSILVGKIACFNADGTLDTSFGHEGLVETEWEGMWHSVVLHEKRIIVAGNNTITNKAVVACYTLDGRLDETFGVGSGFVIDKRMERFNDFVVTPNDMMILVGYEKNKNKPIMVRYTLEGKLDTAFGDGGYVSFDQYGYWNRVIIDKMNNKIIVGGTTFYDEEAKVDKALIAVYRLGDGGGLLKTSSMTRGYFYPNLYVEEVLDKKKSNVVFLREIHDLVLFENKLYVAGSTKKRNGVVVRYNERNELDKTFGEDKTGAIEMADKDQGLVSEFAVYGDQLFFAVNSSVFGLSLEGHFEAAFGGEKGYCLDPKNKVEVTSLAINKNNVMAIGGWDGTKMAVYFVDIKK